MQLRETVCHLEMLSPDWLRPVEAPQDGVELRPLAVPCAELNRWFYREVGRLWRWVDRLAWSERQWAEYVAREEIETCVLYVVGERAGYFELDGRPGGDFEIAYFGLLPAMVGRRLGGHLLTLATGRAWARGAARVWLHTSSFDHPNARANYQARGFRPFREETFLKEIPPIAGL